MREVESIAREILSRALVRQSFAFSVTLEAMSLRTKIVLGVSSVILVVAATIFVFGPVLFASVAYPLPDQYRASVYKWSTTYCTGINQPEHLISALIYTESTWHANSVSGAGAVGLTQIIPSTASSIARTLGVSPFSTSDLVNNPDRSIQFGAYYICQRIKDYGGDVKKGLIAYNGGGGAVIAYEVGSPIYGTVAYANKIMSIQQAYATIYGNWWENGTGSGSSGSTNSSGGPQTFNVQPQTSTSLISTVSLVDFWKGLLTNQSVAATSDQSTNNSSVNSFWKIFLPSSNQ